LIGHWRLLLLHVIELTALMLMVVHITHITRMMQAKEKERRMR
jgi:hypothetical protein